MKILNKFFHHSFFFMHLTLFALLFASSINAQDDIQIGTNLKNLRQTQGGYFDYSDPEGINIKVQLWGYIKYPGYYIVPSNSTLNDLLSLGGGPQEDAMLEDLRIFRMNSDSTSTMYKYNFNDLLWEDSLTTNVTFPRLYAGDVILVPGEPRYFVRQDISFYLSIVTALASLAALIISITK